MSRALRRLASWWDHPASRKVSLYTKDPSRNVALPETFQPVRVAEASFGGKVDLAGYDLPVSEIAAGEDLHVALYWKVRATLPKDTQMAVRLVDKAGLPYRDVRLPGGGVVPRELIAGEQVRLDYTIPVPKAMPGGVYLIAAGVVSAGSELPLDGGSQTGASLRAIRVIGGKLPIPPVPQRSVNILLGNGIRLAGYDLTLNPPRDLSDGLPALAELSHGTVLRLRLYWQDLRAVDRSYKVFAQLVGEQLNPTTGNQVWAQSDAVPGAGQKPTDRLVPGEVIADDHELVVPTQAPAGLYFVQVGLYDQETGRRIPVGADSVATDSIVLFRGQLH